MVTYTPELIKELGNAIAAYGLVLSAAWMGAKVPKEFDSFKNLPEEDLHRRMTILKEFHKEISKNE